MKIRDFINNIKHSLNSVHLDTFISDELIFNEAISVGALFLKRESESRKLYKNSSLYYTLPKCVEMIEVPLSECSTYFTCNTIRRSKTKLPEHFSSSYGSFLNIFNVLRNGRYIETTINQYINKSKLRYKVPNTYYFWIENGYLFIPDSDVEQVVVSGIFQNMYALLDYQESKCTKLLDLSLPFPDFIVSLISEQVINKFSSNLKIPSDENPNMNINEKN